jgi:hypothetical protein
MRVCVRKCYYTGVTSKLTGSLPLSSFTQHALGSHDAGPIPPPPPPPPPAPPPAPSHLSVSDYHHPAPLLSPPSLPPPEKKKKKSKAVIPPPPSPPAPLSAAALAPALPSSLLPSPATLIPQSSVESPSHLLIHVRRSKTTTFAAAAVMAHSSQAAGVSGMEMCVHVYVYLYFRMGMHL